jgi:mannose-6-phosphate isomerase-like protein (cupin superfamily)/DNA-binding XRE family transcriptional regulator
VNTDVELGAKLKEIRRNKGVTLQQIADQTGLSKSFVSQIETGVANPSIASLKKITDVLGVPLGALFTHSENGSSDSQVASSSIANGAGGAAPSGLDPGGEVRVVRRNRRKMLIEPGRKGKMYLLTPDLQRKLEVILGEEQPGNADEEWYSHIGEECGFVLEGRYEVSVGDRVFVLEAGDSIYFPSHLPHKTRVLGDEPVKTIWVITPPSF